MSRSAAALQVETPRRVTRRRQRSNRRVTIQRRAPLVTVAAGFLAVGRGVLLVGRVLAKVLVLGALLVAVVGGGYLAVGHVMASPRFAVRDIEVSTTGRLSREDVIEAAGVVEGDRLLALDTDAIAARVAEHPWVAEARVSRQLPGTLRIQVVERQAAAVVNLGGLYLIDPTGRPFKRATTAEADGLTVITGLERDQYVDHHGPGEAAFREALGILEAWKTRPERPPLSEINLEPRYGFTLFVLDTGAELRLGRGDYDRKLARVDQIFEAVKNSGADIGAIRVVHLDGGNQTRVPVRLQLPDSTNPGETTPASQHP